jgi:hypothetical protein
LWAGFFLGLWRCAETNHIVAWIATGILAAAMMYAKLSSALGLVVACGWLLYDAKARSRLFGVAPWIGAATAALLVLPLYASLQQSSFAPLAHAAERADSAPGSGAINFTASQILALAGLAALLSVADRLAWPNPSAEPLATSDTRARRYLYVITLVPLLLVIVPALLTGSSLRSSWAAPMMCFVGLCAVSACGRRFSDAHLLPIFKGAVGLLVVAPLLYCCFYLWAAAFERRPQRGQWPQAEIAATFRKLWQEETGTRLTYVAGHFWPAGLVAIAPGGIATVVVNGELAAAPGLSIAQLKRDGVLIVNTERQSQTPTTFEGLSAPAKTGELTFALVGARRGQTVTFTYAIIKPER